MTDKEINDRLHNGAFDYIPLDLMLGLVAFCLN